MNPNTVTDLLEKHDDISIENEDCNLIVISDLHIGEGYMQDHDRYSPNENFFSDEAFRNFIAKLYRENTSTDRPLKLIINGDFIDFVRSSSIPDEQERKIFLRYFRRLGLIGINDQFEVHPHENKFGLQTEQYKSVWKLHRIFRGHPIVFEAIAEFLAQGNRLVIIKGNHDLEFFWPAVQKEFIKLLAASLPPAKGYPRSIRARHDLMCSSVEFCQRAYIIEHQLYIEHGHQYEKMTRVDRTMHDEHQLRLPPGSIFNRYLINAMEHLAPLVTRIQGEFQVVRALVSAHRWRALRLLMRHFPIATRMLFRGHRRFTAILFMELAPYLFAMLYAGFMILLPAISETYSNKLIENTGPVGKILIERLSLNIILCIGIFGSLRFLWRFFGPDLKFRLHEALAQAQACTQKAQEQVKKFIVLGHTHSPTVQRFGKRLVVHQHRQLGADHRTTPPLSRR